MFWHCRQDGLNQLPQFLGKAGWDPQIALHYALHGHLLSEGGIVGVGLEGGAPDGHLVDEHSKTPNVYLLIVVVSFYDFGRDVV